MTGGPRNAGDPSVPTSARGGDPIRVGIRSCLLGEKVRFDGGHKLDQYAVGTLGRYVDWVPVCPELEMGLGVPREALRLVGDPEAPRLVTVRSRVDHTEGMLTWTRDKVEQLQSLDLDGYILKSKSPSCGMERVRVYTEAGMPARPNPVGRPKLDAEIRRLIRRMARENPTWGRRRIQAELALLGYHVAELTVAKYMCRTSPRPSPMWRAFLAAHLREMVAVDFFVVPTLTFRLLFVFVVLRHDRRELLHLNVTDHPTAVWTAQQLVEALPDDTAPTYLLRDRDGIYGEAFTRRVTRMGIHQILTAPRAPWQNPFVERVIGSIRRECLDHFFVLNEAHLRRLLRAYIGYYNTARPHQSLDHNSPRPRDVQRPALGRVVAIPQVGGLHHIYQRAA